MADSTRNRPDAKWEIPGVRRMRLAPPPENPTAYVMRVFLVNGPYFVDWDRYGPGEPWRDLQIAADANFIDLHNLIYRAFNRDEPHLWEFNLGKGPSDRSLLVCPSDDGISIFDDGLDSPEADDELDDDGDELEESVDEGIFCDSPLVLAKLELGRRFGYWFDFGDDWKHVLEVREILEKRPQKKMPCIIAKGGKSPRLYPSYD